MLSGIRKGKKKKSKVTPPPPQEETSSTVLRSEPDEVSQPPQQRQHVQRSSQNESTSSVTSFAANQSIAEQLRQSLASGDTSFLTSSTTTTTSSSATTKPQSTTSSSSPSWSKNNPLDHLERRGRIISNNTTTNKNDRKCPFGINPNEEEEGGDDNSNLIVLHHHHHSVASSQPQKKEEDMTIQELASYEARTKVGGNGNGSAAGMSWDEQMTRNAIRVGKKRKMKLKHNEDSDEEVENMKKLLPDQHQHYSSTTTTTTNDDNGIPKAAAATTRKIQKREQQQQQRDEHRQISQYYQQEKIISKCSWWIESSSFVQYRLLALGNHIALIMAPSNQSLVKGHHFYLVPIKHTESFVSCDDNVWEEVYQFHKSLSNLYTTTEGKGIIMYETVLPQKNNHQGIWQTKLEVIPIPFSILQDSQLYFKSSMMEQMQEDDGGTHNMKLYSITNQRTLRNVIPKQNFPYFYVEWGTVVSTSDTTTKGYVQLIESSQQFPSTFGIDTIASMINVDPIRFHKQNQQRKQQQQQRNNNKLNNNKEKEEEKEERLGISNFLAKWKHHDWTVQLDNNNQK